MRQTKFAIRDYVRLKQASLRSCRWKVVKYLTKEEQEKIVHSFTGKLRTVTGLLVQCESFNNNKMQVRIFNEEDLELINS